MSLNFLLNSFFNNVVVLLTCFALLHLLSVLPCYLYCLAKLLLIVYSLFISYFLLIFWAHTRLAYSAIVYPLYYCARTIIGKKISDD